MLWNIDSYRVGECGPSMVQKPQISTSYFLVSLWLENHHSSLCSKHCIVFINCGEIYAYLSSLLPIMNKQFSPVPTASVVQLLT